MAYAKKNFMHCNGRFLFPFLKISITTDQLYRDYTIVSRDQIRLKQFLSVLNRRSNIFDNNK
jgi:hypothetical protein